MFKKIENMRTNRQCQSDNSEGMYCQKFQDKIFQKTVSYKKKLLTENHLSSMNSLKNSSLNIPSLLMNKRSNMN